MPDLDWRATFRKRWRLWLRAIHRDLGYLLVGLTFVYALSGLALNHIGDWDPSYRAVTAEHKVEGPYPEDEDELAEHVVAALGIDEEIRAAFFESDEQFEISLVERTLIFNPQTGAVVEKGQEPRFFLRVANWLHAQRGKKAWNYVADTYAILLLFIACSGLFMLRGKKGVLGRGAVFLLLGIAVPIAYVQLSGGP
jgi:hypothetical protein